MRSIIKNVMLLTMITAAILVQGCGSNGTTESNQDSSSAIADKTQIEQAAREWIDGLMTSDQNRVLKYTCLTERESINNDSIFGIAFRVLASSIFVRGTQVDTSDLKFQALSNDGSNATISTTGELRLAIFGSAEAHQVNEQWVMIYENDTWRWCGTPVSIAIKNQSQNIGKFPVSRREELSDDPVLVTLNYVNAVLQDECTIASSYFDEDDKVNAICQTGYFEVNEISSYQIWPASISDSRFCRFFDVALRGSFRVNDRDESSMVFYLYRCNEIRAEHSLYMRNGKCKPQAACTNTLD